MMSIERVEVLGDPACGSHLCVIGSGRDQPLGRLAGVEVVTFIPQPLEQLCAHDHQALVRPVRLVE